MSYITNTSVPPDPLTLLQHLYTGVIWVDETLTICWVNLQSEQLLSVSSSRLIGTNILDILAPIHSQINLSKNHTITKKSGYAEITNDEVHVPIGLTKSLPLPQTENAETVNDNDDNNLLYKQFLQAKNNQQPFIEYNRYIVGATHPLFVNYSVTPVEQAEMSYFLVEIWEKNRHSRIDKERQLQEQHNIAREMLRSVAHEVKNPLAGIRGAAQLLSKHAKQQSQINENTELNKFVDKNTILVDGKKLNTYANIVINETDRLSNLIGQLLGSHQLPNWQSINIHQSLEHVLALIHSEHPKIQIIRDYDLSLPMLTADKDQLIQVFLNIINNACNAMIEQDFEELKPKYQPHHYQPTLKISTRIEHQHTIATTLHRQVLKVSVQDNGHGIDNELIERIFFPMVTGRTNGTGLGLALAQEMIHRHHGAIEVSSDVGNTIFSIYLPFSQNQNNTISA